MPADGAAPGRVEVLPLESLRVASPCAAAWDAMVGDERRRFCGQCNLHVFNLSAMRREEAEALVGQAAAEGRRLCGRFYVRQDGTVLTADCPVGRRAGRRRLAAFGAALTGLAASVAGLVGLGGAAAPDPLEAERAREWFEPAPPALPVFTGIIAPPRRLKPSTPDGLAPPAATDHEEGM